MVWRKCAECNAEGATGYLRPWPQIILCWQIRHTSACKRVAAVAPTLCRNWDTHTRVEKTVEIAKTAWEHVMTSWALDCSGRLYIYVYIYICIYIYIYIYIYIFVLQVLVCRLQIQTRACTLFFAHKHANAYICKLIFLCTHVLSHKHTHIHTRTHKHTQTHTRTHRATFCCRLCLQCQCGSMPI